VKAAAASRAAARRIAGALLLDRLSGVVALARPGEASPVPLLADRATLDRRATAYVCEHFACRMPVTDPRALRVELAAIR